MKLFIVLKDFQSNKNNNALLNVSELISAGFSLNKNTLWLWLESKVLPSTPQEALQTEPCKIK